MGLIVIAVSFGAMYMLFIRPQQRRMREHQEMVAAIEAGDEVMTNGGVYGTVTVVDGSVVMLEIAEDLEIRLNRSSIAELVTFDPDDDEAVDPAAEPERPSLSRLLGRGRDDDSSSGDSPIIS